jgi:hypothetical protein
MKIFSDENEKPLATGEISELVVVQEKKIFKGNFELHPGMKMWELDLINSMIYETELGKSKAVIGEDKLIRKHRELEIKEDHIYCAAINMENAMRKFHKMLGTKPPAKKLN